MRYVRPRLLVSVSIAVAACSHSPTPPPAVCSAPQGTSAEAKSLAADDTSFAIALYGPAVTLAGAGNNAIFSPYGISATMAMLDVGAAGETDRQIQSVIELPSNGATLAPAYAALACEDETDGASNGNQLTIASSLFGQKGTSFVPAFLSVLASGYDAPFQQVDFADDPSAATSTVNQWVSNATQGKVPAIFSPGDLDTDTRLVTANAIYFKGSWATAFDASSTTSRPFTLADGTQVMATTMENPDVTVSFTNTSAFQLVELPYKGGALAMDFIVPTVSLAALEPTLTPALLEPALTITGREEVQLFVPKFSFGTRLSLAPTLSAMGMPDVFEHGVADLSGIDGAKDLYVTLVVQQALVEIDEDGTMAVAATASGSESAGGYSVPSPLHIDHPFIFLIRDVGTGSILFMGRVEDPRAQ